MKSYLTTTVLITLLVFMLSCFKSTSLAESRDLKSPLGIRGTHIINQTGDKVILNGANFGNWLIMEMWMLDLRQNGVQDQYEFENTLTRRFGKDEKDRLMEIYRSNWITERDFKQFADFGMNTIRLPFDYKLLMDETTPYSLKDNAWFWLDYAVDLAEKYGLFIILDMHGAPGGQSGMDHTGRSGYNQLWKHPEYQDQTVWLWKEISLHYRDNPVIAAYDFLNEPWGGTEEDLKSLILQLYRVVRDQQDDHIVIFPGHYSGIDFYVDNNRQIFTNVMYTMHFYPGFFGWGAPLPQVHADFLTNGLSDWKTKMDSLKAPLYIGEFNVVSTRAGGGEMMRRYFDQYADWGWPATMWAYKVLTQQGGMNEMNWGMVTNKSPLQNPDMDIAGIETIQSWFRSLSTMEYSINRDLKKWLKPWKKPSDMDDLPPLPPPITEAPATDPIPGWGIDDIGDPLPGGQVIMEDEWQVYGGGNDIWTDHDQFRYIWQKVSGDFSLTLTVESLLPTNNYAKAGIMARKSLDPQSAHALINVFPYGNTEFGYRTDAGELMQAKSGPVVNLPGVQLKLTRTADTFTGMVMTEDGWQQTGTMVMNEAGDDILIGLATLSHDNSRLTKAVYRNIKLNNREF